MTKQPDLKDHDLLIRVDSRTIDMSGSLERLAKSVADLASIFASKEELLVTATETEKRFSSIENTIKSLTGPRKIFDTILTSAVSGVALFLILFYLGHIK